MRHDSVLRVYAIILPGTRCIRDLAVKACPFCRRSFSNQLRIHVDIAENTAPEEFVDGSDAYVHALLKRVALSFLVTSAEEEVIATINEADTWLALQSDDYEWSSVSIWIISRS